MVKNTFRKNVKYGIFGAWDHARKTSTAILIHLPRSMVRDLLWGVHFCKNGLSKSSLAPALTLFIFLLYLFVFFWWSDYAKKMRSVRAIILPAESRRDLSPRPCSWKNSFCFCEPCTRSHGSWYIVICDTFEHPGKGCAVQGWAQGRGPAIGQAKWAKRWGRDSFS